MIVGCLLIQGSWIFLLLSLPITTCFFHYLLVIAIFIFVLPDNLPTNPTKCEIFVHMSACCFCIEHKCHILFSSEVKNAKRVCLPCNAISCVFLSFTCTLVAHQFVVLGLRSCLSCCWSGVSLIRMTRIIWTRWKLLSNIWFIYLPTKAKINIVWWWCIIYTFRQGCNIVVSTLFY